MDAPTDERRMIEAEVQQVAAAARAALTDEMVSRLATTAGEAIDLMDQVNRAGLARAIPAIAEMVNNGDLNRLARLARVYASAEDALTDEMVGRMTDTVGQGLSLLDQVNRAGLERAIPAIAELVNSGALERIATLLPQLVDRLTTVQDVLQSIDAAAAASREAPPTGGGLGGLWHMMRDPETQDTLRFLLSIGKQMRKDWGAGKK
jgi:uncharacterized protein YjgD (DUF1641 family)